MNDTVFIEFLNWFKQFTTGRKILLILDGYPCYRTGLDFWLVSNDATDKIRVAFLSPNITSHSQPLNQGIIRTWKAYYRKRWIHFQADLYERGEDLYEKMNVLLAVRWAVAA
jgi:hypothetical protein